MVVQDQQFELNKFSFFTNAIDADLNSKIKSQSNVSKYIYIYISCFEILLLNYDKANRKRF